MNRRMCCFALSISALAAAVIVGCLGDSRRMFTYLPGPSGAVLRCQIDQDREWTVGGTTPHSGGGSPMRVPEPRMVTPR